MIENYIYVNLGEPFLSAHQISVKKNLEQV